MPYRYHCLGCICRPGRLRWQGQSGGSNRGPAAVPSSCCTRPSSLTMSTPVTTGRQLPTLVSRASDDSELALLELQLLSTQSTHQYLGNGRFGLSKSQNEAKGQSYEPFFCPYIYPLSTSKLFCSVCKSEVRLNHHCNSCLSRNISKCKQKKRGTKREIKNI